MNNKQELENIVRMAFLMGEQWGVTHSGWFIPSKEDTEKKIQEAIKQAENNNA